VLLGRIHPDEVFQFLEPANHRAFGYGLLAWEWSAGLRNWAAPGLFSLLLELCSAIGLDHPQARRAVLEVPQYALHVAMLLAAYRFSERRVGAARALWAIPLLGFTGLVIHFAGRTLGESLSTAFLVWGLERLDAKGLKPVALGGGLLGCAMVARYGSAVPIAAAGVVVLAQRRWRESLAALSGLLLVAIALGLLDWATWGRPFHSFLAYVDFNVLSGKGAALFGALPPSFYAQFTLGLVVWAWPGLAFGFSRRAFPESPRPWLMLVPALAYLAAIVATPHKEARFLYPAFVLFEVAALPAWLWALGLLKPRLVGLALVVSVAAGLALVPGLALFGSGDNALSPQRPRESRGDVRRARAGRTRSCGFQSGRDRWPGATLLGR
jgi:GPI mannosyltransferase 3